MAKLKGRDARAANAFLRSVVIWYDSRWLLEREGDEGRAADFHFRQPFAKGRMSNEEYQAYRGMFIKEALKLNARWLIVCNVHFHDGKQEYIESGEIVTDQCRINDAMPAFEALRDELKASGNQRHYRFYTWRAEVYKNQDKGAA